MKIFQTDYRKIRKQKMFGEKPNKVRKNKQRKNKVELKLEIKTENIKNTIQL